MIFKNIYRDKRVFITGNTGFKGSWLALWLQKMGAEICGFSLKPEKTPNHFSMLGLDYQSIFGDIRDIDCLKKSIKAFNPDIVFHLAAQPLVRRSYIEPVLTYETNIMGTVNLLECCRNCESVKAIINVTTDKCYENKEWFWGYRENDPMGGYDPYSSSKGCSELVTSAYRNSFFNLCDYRRKHNILIASARAGNVIGGGDWASDRLVPDIMKAVSENEVIEIRCPDATRPWEHVLEPLSGYLLLGQKLLEGDKEFAEAWNFGPGNEGVVKVVDVIKGMKDYWDKISYEISKNPIEFHEAGLLKLDCSKAHAGLGWNNTWDMNETLKHTVEWYRCYFENTDVVTSAQLDKFIEDAATRKIKWAIG